jgi:hypothetical protein
MFRRGFRLAAGAASGAALALATTQRSSALARADRLIDHDPVLDTLDALYADLADVHELPISDAHAIDASGGHVAYGELTPRGVRQLRGLLEPESHDTFYDLGSGAARLVLQAALEWPCRRSVGVELAESRHAVGMQALSRLAAPDVRERVELRCADMLNDPRSEDATLVYVASLLFDEEFMERLGHRLAELPHVRAVASLARFPEGSLPGFVEDATNFASDDDEKTRRERLEVTWGGAPATGRTLAHERALKAQASSHQPDSLLTPRSCATHSGARLLV